MMTGRGLSRKVRGALFLGVTMGLGVGGGSLHAETLADAIALAYQSNPALQQARTQLRAVDETYVQARAGWRPTASIQVTGNYSKLPQSNGFGGTSEVASNSGQATLQLTQPIYTGGRTAAEVRATEADVLSGRQSLRLTEASTLQNVITVYMSVLRDQDELVIHEHDVAVLQGEVDDARARFKAGEVTATDVAQVETQLSQSRTALTQAQGQLQVDRASYAAVVGQNPGHLEDPPSMPGIPSDVSEAFAIAARESPSFLQAQIAEEASRARVAAARAANRPTVNLTGGYSYSGAISPFVANSYAQGLTATVTLTQPLFTGGANESAIREALDVNTSDRIGIEIARRNTVQAVSQSWNEMITDRATVVSEEDHVRVARAYFSGTQAEFTVGQRQTLDIIIAEQSLVTAELTLAGAKHDAYVAAASLLASIGRLEARYVVPGAPLYDPAQSFKHVAHIGAVPWEGIVGVIDNLGAPAPDAHGAIPAPLVDSDPALAVGPDLVGAHPAPSTALPTAPVPNTTSPRTPDTLGAEVGVPQDPAPNTAKNSPDRTPQ